MKGKKIFIGMLVTGIIMVTFLIGGVAKPAAPELKTLKIGLLAGLQGPLGRDYQRLLEVLIPIYNQKGGLVIGGERYKIDLIVYDSKESAETGRAAVERLVSQDNVKFILGDVTADAWVPVTEENKVVSINYTPSIAMLSPKLKYTFQGSSLNTSVPVIWSWFSKKFPRKKTIGALFTDNLHGHADAKQLEQICGLFGLKLVTTIFYPPTTTDFSAYATKMKTANPQVYTCAGGGPVQDSLSVKFLRESGYKGLFFSYRGVVAGLFGKIVPLELLEGAIFVTGDIELDPPLSPISKEAKGAYIAKYGKWDYPAVFFSGNWFLLKAALESAASIDPDKVAATIGKGLRFDTTQAPAMMISRPDQNNPRTIDTVYGAHVATLEKGKLKIVHSITPDEAFEHIKKSKIFGVYK